MAPVTAVVIGAGDRGFVYSSYALDFPEKFKACIILLLCGFVIFAGYL